MAYYEKVLQPDERVLYNRKLHWIIYFYPILFLVLCVIFTILAKTIKNEAGDTYSFLAVFWFLAFVCTIIPFWIERFTTEVVVTNKRIIFKRGLIIRKTMEMNMNKVETVDVDQSIMGRFLNYATVYIRGSGSTYEPLRNVDKPLDLRNSIIVK